MSETTLMAPARKPVQERFWPKVAIAAPDECWPWLASVDRKGYGKFGLGAWAEQSLRTGIAHRVAWQLTYGDIPPGLSVLHRCDHPRCCNPAHLFLGTQADNIADCIRKGRFHTGENSGTAKLTSVQVLTIRAADPAVPLSILARQFGVHKHTIHLIRRGVNWKHVAEQAKREPEQEG